MLRNTKLALRARTQVPMEILYPNQDVLERERRYVWNLPGKDLDEAGLVKDFDVTACEIKHTKSMPSIGYVLQEPTLPRNLVIENVRHHLELHKDWIQETYVSLSLSLTILND